MSQTTYSIHPTSHKKIPFPRPFLIPLILFLLILMQAPPFTTEGICNNPWNQFRGNNRDGRIKLDNLEMTWIEGGPQLLWSREIGSGFSEAVVVGDRVYLMMAEKTDSITGWETLVCMDALSGETIWSTRIDKVFIDEDDWGDGPRSTPAVDDHMVYCLSASGKLAAIDRQSGQIQWAVDFVQQYGGTIPRWGYSTSPLLVDDLVIMEVGGTNDHGFVAFKKSTGELKWHAGSVSAAYNSPVMAQPNESRMIIFANGSSLYAFDVNGNALWTYTMPLRSPMALPLLINPGNLFVSAANDAGSFILDITGPEPVEVIRSTQMRNDWSSSCYKDGFIYGFNVATLQCMDAETGQRKWLRRGFGKGSLILIHDRLVVLSDLGTITTVEATPEGYREITVVEKLEGRSWTAPSYANGKLYVRNHTHIACFRILEPSDHLKTEISEPGSQL
jgi:outer membrane protein assembly factor BamB